MIRAMSKGMVPVAATAAGLFCVIPLLAGCATFFPQNQAAGRPAETATSATADVTIAGDDVRMTGSDVERAVIVADRVARRFGMVATPALELAGYTSRNDEWSYRSLGYFPRGASFGGAKTLAFAIVIQRKKDGSELVIAIDNLGRPKPPEFIRQLGRELRDELAEAFGGYEITVRDRTWIASTAPRSD